ncbi:MAG: GNAT family N-acetyltransferase [Burkholderiales bacterium]
MTKQVEVGLSPRGFSLRLATWKDDAAMLRDVRRRVFVREQNIPEELEWDEHDTVSLHVLALDAEGHAIGTARLLADGHLGRVAVLKNQHGKGVGSELIKYLILLNKNRGAKEAVLSAQINAIPFYASHGFVAEGEEYLDADIPHRLMRLVY